MEKQVIKVFFLMGGLPHYFTRILNKLNAYDDMEIVLAIPEKRGSTLGSGVHESQEGADFTLVELPEYKTWYGKSFFKGIKELVQAQKPDILVTGWPYMMHFVFNPMMLGWLRDKGIKVIYRDIPFNIPPYGKVAEFLESGQLLNENMGKTVSAGWWAKTKLRLLTEIRKSYLQVADAHIYYVDTAYELMKTYGIPKEKIFITANSPDTDRLLAVAEKVKSESALLPHNLHRIIHVGRLVKWKRVDLIIRAINELKIRFPNIELLVVGYGPEEDNLKQEAMELGLDQQVKFIGGVYNMELLGKYLNESAVYVLAGMGGLSINDAMCFAKPIICSVADGTERMLVREGENGCYFENGSAHDLQLKIEALLSSPDQVAAFGAKSLEIIQKRVNIHTVLDQYRKAFRYVMRY